MERGLYIAASGMVAEQMRQDQIANDLANASTPGYKADRVTQKAFADLLLSNTAAGQQVGGHGAGVARRPDDTDPRRSRCASTGEPLDLAIAGDGWFAVQTAQGVRYTRNGQFATAADGHAHRPARQRGARHERPAGEGGRPTAPSTAQAVGVFALTTPAKQGDNLFSGTAGGPGRRHVRTGALEGSGVDPARTMVDMIASFRAFEAGQKAIQTIDESLHKAAGRLAAGRPRPERRGAGCSKASTPPRPAWPPSSSGSTASPTTSRTPPRPATSTCASASATCSTTRRARRRARP